jgi:thioesterase domain-containing protein
MADQDHMAVSGERDCWRLIQLSSGARVPLFCVFPGPPGARYLADALPDDQPVYEFHYPNLDGKASFPRVEELATEYLRDIRTVQPNGPYQLCGYSDGGLIAYEMARLLQLDEQDVWFLALLETRHPQFFRTLSFRERARIYTLYLTDRFEKYRKNLKQKGLAEVVDNARNTVAARVKLAFWQASRIIFRKIKWSVPRSMQEVEAIAQLNTYVPKKPYPKRLVYVRTNSPFEKYFEDQTLGWRSVASGVDVIFAPGDHVTMISAPHAVGLVQQIYPYLLKAVAAPRREGEPFRPFSPGS